MCAIGALMRKLVHWCYGVLKTQKPFDVGYLPSYARSAHDVVTYGTGVTPPKPGVSRYVLIDFTYPIPALRGHTGFQR